MSQKAQQRHKEKKSQRKQIRGPAWKSRYPVIEIPERENVKSTHWFKKMCVKTEGGELPDCKDRVLSDGRK